MSDFNFREKAGAFASAAAGKAKGFAVFAAKKTKQMSRIAKLNMDISAEENSIKRAYAELGRLYYETFGENPEEALSEICAQITASYALIEVMEEEITDLKSTDTAETAEEADFEAVVEDAEAEAEADIEVVIEEEVMEPEIEIIEEDPIVVEIVEEPVVEEAAPVEEEPVAEEAAPVEDEPIVEEAAPVEDEPVIEDAAPVEDEPVIEEAAPVEDEPVIEEAAPVEEEPVAEEAAPVEDEPVAEEAAPEAEE